MASAIDAHLHDLENEAKDAEREYEEYKEQCNKRIEALNKEIQEVVRKTQIEKAQLKESLERKQQWVKAKADEVAAFRDTLTTTPSLVSTSRYQGSSRPSVFSEPTRNSLASIDDSFTRIDVTDTPDPPKPSFNASAGAGTGVDASTLLSQQKYLPDIPIISRGPDGTWRELRCFICGGNYIDKKSFIRGSRGMLAHVSKSHKVDTYGGKKLDSTNIFEFCTHRQLQKEEVEAILEGTQKVESIICRDVNSGPPIPVPRVSKVIALAHGDGLPPESDHDQPYDWLQKYPTIVLRKDGQWVELRCDICGGNSLANSDKRFAMGVIGFVRHLSRGHGVKPETPQNRLEWTIRRCTYREVEVDEIHALTEETPGTPVGPPKIPFRQSNRDSAGSDFLIPPKRRLGKRPSEVMDQSEDDDMDEPEDGADPDFNPDEDKNHVVTDSAKKARYSLGGSGQKQTSRFGRKPKESPLSDLGTPMSSSPGVRATHPFEKYCPCSLSGHVCGDPNCTKIAVCQKQTHDDKCLNSGDSHDVKPTCVLALLGSECADGDNCMRGHDNIDERKTLVASHDCKNHS